MLLFVSKYSDASVFIGLKFNPDLNRIILNEGKIKIPKEIMRKTGEYISQDIIDLIYDEAKELCPDYPLYRHTACALGMVLERANYTATIFRKDVCLPSHCPDSQRERCEKTKKIPDENNIREKLQQLEGKKNVKFKRKLDKIIIEETLTQQEYTFLLHNLNCPIDVNALIMENIYHGDIYKGQIKGN